VQLLSVPIQVGFIETDYEPDTGRSIVRYEPLVRCWASLFFFSEAGFGSRGIMEELPQSMRVAMMSCLSGGYQSQLVASISLFRFLFLRIWDAVTHQRRYVGWSNCRDRQVKEVFRRMYTRPGFLPTDLRESHTDWLFMGLPGPGADLHHDAIFEPSWQAQVRCSLFDRNLQPILLFGSTLASLKAACGV
jgi:hypothetical protein